MVATPLGNLRDVTLRALDVLASADVIAAEDTRVTTILLRHYGIATRPLSLHAHNEARRAAHIECPASCRQERRARQRRRHAGGERSGRAARRRHPRRGPAGDPDPRSECGDRRDLGRGTCGRALRLSRFPADGAEGATSVAHRGRGTSARARRLRGAASRRPHRSADLADALGGEREVVVAREITKKFETITRMPLADVSAWLDADAESVARRIRAARRRAVRFCARRRGGRPFRWMSTGCCARSRPSFRPRARRASPPTQRESRAMRSTRGFAR